MFVSISHAVKRWIWWIFLISLHCFSIRFILTARSWNWCRVMWFGPDDCRSSMASDKLIALENRPVYAAVLGELLTCHRSMEGDRKFSHSWFEFSYSSQLPFDRHPNLVVSVMFWEWTHTLDYLRLHQNSHSKLEFREPVQNRLHISPAARTNCTKANTHQKFRNTFGFSEFKKYHMTAGAGHTQPSWLSAQRNHLHG